MDIGFVYVRISELTLHSCYIPPSASLADLENTSIMDKLVSDARTRTYIVIAGDFNAWAREWCATV